MYVVYVLDKNKNPLMPTTRFGHVRKLLNEKRAKAVSTKPFVIQLLYDSTKYIQPLYGGTDPGRTNIGEAVVNEKGKVVFSADVISRNKEIPKLMSDRARHRRASRYGERQRRKRRAKKNGTTTTFPEGRKLPRYKTGVLGLKDIINTEAKFANRKRPVGWLTPTARQCVQTHINVIKQIRKILPITSWTLEYNKFAFMLLEDGSVKGMDFQNGRMKGFASVNEYVCSLQDEHCILCSSVIEHYHHIVPRHKGGSNTPENIVGLCSECHSKIHKNKITLNAIGLKKKYAGTSIINIAMPYIYEELLDMFGEKHFHVCDGYATSNKRVENNIGKEHSADAACIASIGGNINLKYDMENIFEIRQYRNHDRAYIKSQRERTYKIGKEIVAKNRQPRFEQPKNVPALSNWFEDLCNDIGSAKARNILSRANVVSSKRRYNRLDRVLPGAIFLFQGKPYIMQSQVNNGNYYLAIGQGKKTFPARNLRIISKKSLVYV